MLDTSLLFVIIAKHRQVLLAGLASRSFQTRNSVSEVAEQKKGLAIDKVDNNTSGRYTRVRMSRRISGCAV